MAKEQNDTSQPPVILKRTLKIETAGGEKQVPIKFYRPTQRKKIGNVNMRSAGLQAREGSRRTASIPFSRFRLHSKWWELSFTPVTHIVRGS